MYGIGGRIVSHGEGSPCFIWPLWGLEWFMTREKPSDCVSEHWFPPRCITMVSPFQSLSWSPTAQRKQWRRSKFRVCFFYHCLDSLRTRRPWWEGWKSQNLVLVDCLSRQYGVHQEFVPPPHLLLFVCCYSLGKTLRLFSWLVVICLAQFQAPVCRVYTGKAWHCGRQSRPSPSLPPGSPVGRASVSAMLS